MRKQRPRVAYPNEAVIKREGECGVIEFKDGSVSATNLKNGPAGDTGILHPVERTRVMQKVCPPITKSRETNQGHSWQQSGCQPGGLTSWAFRQ